MKEVSRIPWEAIIWIPVHPLVALVIPECGLRSVVTPIDTPIDCVTAYGRIFRNARIRDPQYNRLVYKAEITGRVVSP